MNLMIIDGNSIVNRAFYGVRALNAPDGTPTNAVYGFVAIFQRIYDEVKPDAVCVSFDLKEPTFRHKAYDGYKAQRKPMPDELAVQMPLLKDVLDAMGIRRYELAGYEADDILGAFSRTCENDGWTCTVVTGDKDSLQLISDKTTVCNVKSRMGKTETIMYTPSRFVEEYGFAPPLMVDLKALMGDVSDNIPGVPGIGEKTAMELVQRFGTVESIYENLAELDIKDGVRKKLAAGEESAKKSYWLATILRELPLEFKPDDALWNKNYTPALYGVFKRLGFNKFIEKWGLTESVTDAPAGAANSASALERVEVMGSDEAAELAARLSGAALVAVTAANGLDAIELCDGERVYALSWAQCGDGYNALLRAVFAPGVKKIGSGVKDLMRLLLDEGLSADGFAFDAALAGYLLAATDSEYSEERLSMRYLGREAHGAEALWALYPVMDAKLKALGMDALYYSAELPLCRVLADMERVGFTLTARRSTTSARASTPASPRCRQAYGNTPAVNSTSIRQSSSVKCCLTGSCSLRKKTKTGWSTNADVLEKAARQAPDH